MDSSNIVGVNPAISVSDKEELAIKKPSDKLVSLFELGATAFQSFAEVWTDIRQKGLQEGFTEKELEVMFIPYLKAKGLNRHKIRYLFHTEEMKDASKKQYEQMRNITQIDKLTFLGVDNEQELLTQKEQEIIQLKSRIAELERARELTADQKAQLAAINEKTQMHEQELLKFYKDVEQPWCARKADNVLEWAKDLEIEYTILGKPLGTILKDIVYQMKFRNVAEGGMELIYHNFPDKYKVNYSKSQMLYEIYGV
jgi:hypothetical protein